jgi:hypothetical protein
LSVENGKDMLAYKGQIEITKHTKFFWKSAQRISFTKIASRIVMQFFKPMHLVSFSASNGKGLQLLVFAPIINGDDGILKFTNGLNE